MHFEKFSCIFSLTYCRMLLDIEPTSKTRRTPYELPELGVAHPIARIWEHAGDGKRHNCGLLESIESKEEKEEKKTNPMPWNARNARKRKENERKEEDREEEKPSKHASRCIHEYEVCASCL